ncbi:MAG: class I mannose-6-phosphate isomerase [Phycisphaerales bacterium]|nr:class I mannose-6-phosphate isomerase [Phycisphaerales bacterium]
MSPLEPFLLERIALPKVWGGRMLAKALGIALPPDVDVGETWELYDRPEGSSRLRGRTTTIADLMATASEPLLGEGVPAAHGRRFPLMLKFLDARDALSVQVHPDDALAAADDDSGKNEACVVLQAGPDARFIRGLRPGVDRARFLAAVGTPQLEELLWSFRPEVGDTIHIPPGTIHAIGPGLVVFEVQQNSDLTYRIHDWGRGRAVHVQKAAAAADAQPTPSARPVVAPTPLADGGAELVATGDFRVRRYALKQRFELRPDGRFCTVTCVAGGGTLWWPGERVDGTLALATGDTALVPACCPRFDLIPNESMNVLVCDPGVR